MTAHVPPPALAHELRRLTQLELSPRARAGYVALLLASAAMTAITGALLLTERGLPPRTQIAFATLATIGLGWVGFASWVLTHTRILLGRQRVVAGVMAVLFTTTFTAGALLIGFVAGRPGAFAAAGLGLGMLTVAGTLLVRARRRFAELSSRRAALERELGGSR
jgi:hypothetical protein